MKRRYFITSLRIDIIIHDRLRIIALFFTALKKPQEKRTRHNDGFAPGKFGGTSMFLCFFLPLQDTNILFQYCNFKTFHIVYYLMSG